MLPIVVSSLVTSSYRGYDSSWYKSCPGPGPSTRTAAMAGPGQGGPRLRWTNEDVDMGDWILPGDYDLNTVRSQADITIYMYNIAT